MVECNIKAYSQCCRKQRSAFCVQLRRLASNAKRTQGLVAAEMKKLSQVQLSALRQLACLCVRGVCFQYYSVSMASIAGEMAENPRL